jgi:hypothetical protein
VTFSSLVGNPAAVATGYLRALPDRVLAAAGAPAR